MAGQQAAAPPAQGAPAAGTPAQGAQQDAGADTRMDRLEATQREQGAVLERVLAAVTGGSAGAHAAPAQGQGQGQQAPPNPAEIAAQVRREIGEADQRRRAEEDDKTWRAGVTEVIEKVKAENAPREPETGFRARLQRFVVGKEPG
jgi:hypothetical protein